MESCICSKEKEIGVIQNDIQTLYRRVEDVETENKGMRELVTAVALLAETAKGIKEDVAGVKADVADVKKDVIELKEAPSKNYNQLKMSIAIAIIGVVIGIVLKTLGG